MICGRKLRLMSGVCWLALLLIVPPFPEFGPSAPELSGAAFAQDDDGGDDDNDDDNDDDDGPDRARSDRDNDRAVVRRSSRTSRPARAVVAAPLATFAPAEIVVTDLSEADLAILLTEGFAVIERIALVDVATVLFRLLPPAGLTLEEARDRVRAQPTGATGDFNHYYRTEQQATPPETAAAANPVALLPEAPCTHLNCAMLDLIDWPAARDRASTCRVTVRVGVLDTGVNAAHENLLGADIEVLRLVAEQVDPSKAVHGTAVTALLVGQPNDRAPGLIPEAKVVVVDVFGRDGSDERATVASMIRGLDLFAVRGIKVINMSLAGPANAALEAVLARVTRPEGAVVLAATGNGGPQGEVAYPSGYPSVIAVTAVDQRGQIYRRAQRGAHVDLAAPGVDVWSATSISGVKPKTGTSFAVPFATAVAAILASRDPTASPTAIADRMRGLVQDMGAPGPDEVFGAGLLALSSLCGPEIPAGPAE